MPFPVDANTRIAIAAHFRRTPRFAWSEEFFLSMISPPIKRHDVYWSVIALRDCGTGISVPALKGLATFAVRDVKATALLAIAAIAGPIETPYFAECLLSPECREKAYALWAIGETGDERARGAVFGFLKKHKSRLRRTMSDRREQIEALVYFGRMAGLHPWAAHDLRDNDWLLESLTTRDLAEVHARAPNVRSLVQSVGA